MGEYINKSFPSQAVSDTEKMSWDYGLQVGKAIKAEWFEGTTSRYLSTYNKYHRLRLYARGEQPIQKYKDELAIDGDLSYLNLDWKPVPIIPKFVDIVVNGMAERNYEINAMSRDAFGAAERTEYMNSLLSDIEARTFDEFTQAMLGVNGRQNEGEVPETRDEIELHMQLDYKQGVEIAEEQAINTILDHNQYDLTRRRVLYDLVTLGKGVTRTDFNYSDGVTVSYCDPAQVVHSYSDNPYFDDLYYIGEVKELPINELVREFPHLSETDIEYIVTRSYDPLNIRNNSDRNRVNVLYFNYKTHANDVYKIKKTSSGGEKIIPKDDSFNPPSDMEGDFARLDRVIEIVYEGVMVLGCDKMLKWNICENIIRNDSDYGGVKMNYQIVAPRMYRGKVDSLVNRITGFADMIQITHLKLQQVMSRMVPDGVYLDADGLAEIDLGNGRNYNPSEALNMFFQTGSVIGRSYTIDGELNRGSVPIKEITSGSGGGKMQSLIGAYNYYLQMIRDVTGLNEARDGSMPDPNTLVGVQQMAAANSNTATKHILDAMMYITAEVAENISLRVADIIQYSPMADAFIRAIGMHNFARLEDLQHLHLRDFGIYINLLPDQAEKQMLEANIQQALAQQLIEVDDAIDIRQIRNIKLANQLLKVKRAKRDEQKARQQQQMIESQSQANQQQTAAAAQAEMQKTQAKTQSEIQIDAAATQNKKSIIDHEVQAKLLLMEKEADIARELANINQLHQSDRSRDQQQSAERRENIKAKAKFESSGNDTVGKGIDAGGKYAP